MSWSCNRDAGITMDLISERCVNETGTSNGFMIGGCKYMLEVGQEQDDGAICATIWKFQPDGTIKKTTSLRIEPDGVISHGLSTFRGMNILILEIDGRREAWLSRFGEPIEDNVRAQLQIVNDSYKSNGVNSHVVVNGGTKVVSEARIVDLENNVVAEYRHAMFQVV